MRISVLLWLASYFMVLEGISESQVKNYASTFKQTLNKHLEEKLSWTQLRQMIKDHEKELGIRKINGSTEFERIFQAIQLRFTDLKLSVGNLKSAVEKSLNGPSHGSPGLSNPVPPPKPGSNRPPQPPGSAPKAPPIMPSHTGNGGPPPISGSGLPITFRHCCKNPGLLKYSGRFREKVFLEECYENADDQLVKVRNTGIIDKMKENEQRDSSVTWQYFVGTSRHYIQYPANDRACDKQTSSLNSPLTEEWFAEKLRMERKNLIILVDNGLETQSVLASGSPMSRRNLLADAVKRTLHTLTANDKMNVVIFPYGSNMTGVTSGCAGNLLVATQRNVNLLSDFVQTSPVSNAQPNLMEGLTTAYNILEKEHQDNKATFDRHSNLLLILMDGESKPAGLDGTSLFELMARYQKQLGSSIQHFVYLLGEPDSDKLTNQMAQIADQNNLKITLDSGRRVDKWTAVPGLVSDGQTVGKEGYFMVVHNITDFPFEVSTYFEKLPPKLDNINDITTITPLLDGTSGIKMSLAAVVYNNSEVIGISAVDATLATVFSEIDNFDVGQDSYMYLLELNHGHVLMHPKLQDPDETNFDDTLFPRLEMLEPELTKQERTKILKASTTLGSFDTTQLATVRHLVSGEIVRNPLKTPIPATVYFQRLRGTDLCVVLVHFYSDAEEARLQITTGNTQKLHAPYHRIDKTVLSPFPNKPDKDLVCHLYNKFVSFKESVIKLSPSVFALPERYKYKAETIQDINEINSFLINGGDTKLIREDAKALIQQTVRATNGLDILWQQSSKDVIDRFYGSTSGVFRLYPGLPLQNRFDHMKTDWYQRSIASTNTTFYHYGKLTEVTRKGVVIVSRAVTEQGGLQGVVGLTVTARYLSSQLLNSVDGCLSKGLTCHIVDVSGYILDNVHSNAKQHLTYVYPWLVARLLKNGNVQMDWCTGFSDGYHKLIYTLAQKLTSDSSSTDKCKHYRLEPVTNTNLFLLLLEGRQLNGCTDTMQPCSNCGSSPFNPRYHLTLPKCTSCSYNTTQCQCPCYCMTDFDICHGQFKTGIKDFPTSSCFYSPVVASQPELQPDSPGPMFEHCSIPCAAIEDLTACHNLSHCKLSSDSYPVCIWKDKDELKNITESKFLPTTPPPTPPPILTSQNSPLKTPRFTTVGPAPGKPPGLSTTAAIPPLVMASTTTPKPLMISTKGPPILPHTGGLGPPLASSTTIKTPNIASIESKKSREPSTQDSSTTSVTSSPGSLVPSGLSTEDSLRINISTTLPPGYSITQSPRVHTSSDGHSQVVSMSTNSSSSVIKTGVTDSLTASDKDSSAGMSGGQIAALTIGLLAFVVIAVLLVMRFYGKKFRRPGAAESSKYFAGSSLFNSSFFNRTTEEVTVSTGPSSTVTYKEMTEG